MRPNDEPVMSVAKPAWKLFAIPAVLSVVGAVFFWPAAIFFGVLALYVLYFFRDPGRTVPQDPGVVVSPADGKVVSVIEVPCDRFPTGRARRVAIFLNVFNVHIQRASLPGKVLKIDRKPGKFINAMNEKCSEENEQVTLWCEGNGVPFGIRQIAGAIARRIVCYVAEGQELRRGERYGLIQFGSRVELFLPLDAEIVARPGQIVKGGSSVLGRLR